MNFCSKENLTLSSERLQTSLLKVKNAAVPRALEEGGAGVQREDQEEEK